MRGKLPGLRAKRRALVLLPSRPMPARDPDTPGPMGERPAVDRATDKVEAVVRLAGGVAHDFNNLLTVIAGNAETILELGDAQPWRREILEIADAARRAATLTHQLLAFSRQQVLNPRATDVGDLVRTQRPALEHLAGPRVRFEVSTAGEAALAFVDADQLVEALRHLVRNASEAMPDGGDVVLAVRVEDVDADAAAERTPMPTGAYVVLSLRDSGLGMDAGTLARAFEPFFTTKGQKHGTGMGLPAVYGIVKQSGGFIWLDSAPGAGTTCEIYLPAVDVHATSVRQRTPVRGHALREGAILLVEDEDLVRQLARRTLERAGFQVVDAPNAQVALSAVRDGGFVPDLLLTDVIMPGMDGRELASVLEEEYPGVAVILMSGFADPRLPMLTPTGGTRRFYLEKPFSLEDLRQRVREALAAAAVGG